MADVDMLDSSKISQHPVLGPCEHDKIINDILHSMPHWNKSPFPPWIQAKKCVHHKNNFSVKCSEQFLMLPPFPMVTCIYKLALFLLWKGEAWWTYPTVRRQKTRISVFLASLAVCSPHLSASQNHLNVHTKKHNFSCDYKDYEKTSKYSDKLQ